MRKPKTPFGVEVTEFCARFGITKRELASLAEVKYMTLCDVECGRSAGHQLVPKVREAMAEYRRRIVKETIDQATQKVANM